MSTPEGKAHPQYDFAECFETLKRAEQAHKKSISIAQGAKKVAREAQVVATKAYSAIQAVESTALGAQEASSRAENLAKRNQKNVLKLARHNLIFDSRLKHVERKEVLGYIKLLICIIFTYECNSSQIKIEGRNVPKKEPNEYVYPKVRDLAWKVFKIKINPHDVGDLRRLGN